ncbi:MFS general substrate transporter [Tuber magnatum]|uniref:MFS general substrate transporter n=1 Tax=Tuber magnatum TaxID=42249 RepID=A0A317T083_9PEZI|nr:MFS general substrate transporter [Tuber magnatum]
MPHPLAPLEEPETNKHDLPKAFDPKKSIVVANLLLSSYAEKPQSEFSYLEWDTPSGDLYADPERLPSSVTCYTDPFTWPMAQKNAIVALASLSTAMGAYSAGAYTSGLDKMMEEWHVSRLVLLGGITTFTAGFALPPLVLGPFSEVYVYLVTFGLFNVCLLASALCHSSTGMLVIRFFLGVGGSTFGAMIGGIISDIFHAQDRGFPMALFAMFGLAFTGVGPLVSGVIETRGSVLLSRKAKALNRFLDENGDRGNRWKVKADEERETIALMVRVSLTRPFRFLVTESVVFWFSCWLTFAWGILYMFLEAIPLVFIESHGFTIAQVGYVFAAMPVGCILALCCNTLVEISTEKYFADSTPTPESRLYSACTLGCLLPIGLFWFGWTSFPSQHWILPTMAVGCVIMGIYSIYLAVFNYFADTYHQYASSALAAQSFCRNFFAGGFPLVADFMYHRMGFSGASSLLGCVGALLTIVPWVLMFYGTKIRARSKFARVSETTPPSLRRNRG